MHVVKHTYPESLLHLVLPRISVPRTWRKRGYDLTAVPARWMGESPRERAGELEYGPNDMTTETALPGAPHYWVSIYCFAFIDACLTEVHSVFWAIRRRSRNGVYLRSAGARR